MQERSYVEDLEFDLPKKLLEELVQLFDEMPSGKLNSESLKSVQEEQGVYQLFKDDDLVYIGKTDSDAGLKNRLLRHSRKIQSRKNLEVNRVTFKAIRVYVFTAMDLEGLLINYYKENNQRPEWQHSGFGSNDPGRERDTTRVKDSHFDAKYPIDLGATVTLVADSGSLSIAELLQQLKKQLTYNIRFQTSGGSSRAPHPDLTETEVDLDSQKITVLECLKVATAALGNDWQITALPGYIIVYKETAPKRYPSGQIIEP